MIFHCPQLLIQQLRLLVTKLIEEFIFFSHLNFSVDATDCGSGNLEIAVSINEKNIPNYVQNEGGARFRVKFVPDQCGTYYVHIKFNGIDLHGKKNKLYRSQINTRDNE